MQPNLLRYLPRHQAVAGAHDRPAPETDSDPGEGDGHHGSSSIIQPAPLKEPFAGTSQPGIEAVVTIIPQHGSQLARPCTPADRQPERQRAPIPHRQAPLDVDAHRWWYLWVAQALAAAP